MSYLESATDAASSTSSDIIQDAFLGMPRQVRRQFLRDNWGFDCACPICLAPAEQISASDSRRMRIVKVRERLRDARRRGQREEALDLAREMLGLCETEDLPALMPEFQGVLGELHLEAGDVDEAERYGRMALEGFLEFHGSDSPRADNARRFLAVVRKQKGSKASAA